MAKCTICEKPMVLMAGHITLNPDSEPYISGEEKELDLTIDKYLCAHYCENCDKLYDVWEE